MHIVIDHNSIVVRVSESYSPAPGFIQLQLADEDPLPQPGDIYNAGVFTTPPAAVAAAPKLSPVQFKLCFTSAERIAIKALRATNQIIDDAYEILDDPRLTTVDMSLASNQAMIDYLVTLAVLTAERAVQVKAGVML